MIRLRMLITVDTFLENYLLVNVRPCNNITCRFCLFKTAPPPSQKCITQLLKFRSLHSDCCTVITGILAQVYIYIWGSKGQYVATGEHTLLVSVCY
jgi:hypothetical protein